MTQLQGIDFAVFWGGGGGKLEALKYDIVN